MRQRCREQRVQALLGLWQAAQQVTNILDEAEVEHAVGLVEDGDLVQLEDALLEIVDDAARRADQDIDAVLQYLALFVVIGATKCKADLQSRMAAENLGVLGYLHSEFAGRSERKNARLAWPVKFHRVL